MPIKKIILASQSPRRSEILQNANYDFALFPTHVSEILDKNLNGNEQIIDIARRKARACQRLLHDQSLVDSNFDAHSDLILAADTMVCLNDQVLGKPDDEKMAFEFLKSLSGCAHLVKTAVCLIDLETSKEESLIETTTVLFRTLNDSEILTYISTSEPMDKAGAYAIQGLGGKFVSEIRGDYNNVVGLPLHAIEKLFKIKSWTCKRRQPGSI